MKSNLIVITVAAALITTTVTIIHPPYSSFFLPLIPRVMWCKLDVNNPN